MNIAKIYSGAVGRIALPNISPDGAVMEPENSSKVLDSSSSDLPKDNEDAARKQAKYQWLSSTITQEYLKQKNVEYESLIELAMKTAVTFHNHQNHYQIISTLIRANELKKLITEQQK